MTTNKQLRELAEKAGAQEWGQEEGNVVALGGWPNSSGPLVLASANEHFPEHALNTAAYMAAANPAAVLTLMDAYEALQAECEKLRAALKRLCNIYVVDDYYSGEERERWLEEAVRRSIDAVGGLEHE